MSSAIGKLEQEEALFSDAIVIQGWVTLEGDQYCDWFDVDHVEEAAEIPCDADI